MTSTFSRTSFAGWYFMAQAVAIAGWWLYLFLDPRSNRIFTPPGASSIELLAFRLPDLAVAVPASFGAAVTFFGRSRWAMPLGWLAAGAIDYAFFYCLSWSWQRGGGWINVALMAPAALLSTVAALDASAPHLAIFRRAAAGPPARHIAATFGQIALFWSFFLFVVPAGVTAVERRLEWPAFSFPGQHAAAAVAFLLFSALGLSSGVTMAARGDGTPLPFAAPNRLVTAGPYAYVRNPMVIAGLGQGLAVAAWSGSFAVAAYVVVGGLIWNFLVRPAEEGDLLGTFGDDFAVYRREVRCWLPRVRPFGAGPPDPADRAADAAASVCGINGVNRLERYANLGCWVRSSLAGRGIASAAATKAPPEAFFLRTGRIGFRLWRLADLPLAAGLWGDPEVTRFIGGPLSPAAVEKRLAAEIASQDAHGVQYWPIFLLATGEHLGCCGLHPYPAPERTLELGFHLRPAFWRRGLAREAAQATIRHAFADLGAEALFAGHHPANAASRALLASLGFRYVRDELFPPTGLLHPSYLLRRDEAGTAPVP